MGLTQGAAERSAVLGKCKYGSSIHAANAGDDAIAFRLVVSRPKRLGAMHHSLVQLLKRAGVKE